MVTTLRRGFLALALVIADAIGTAAAAEATTPAGATPCGDVTVQSWYPGTTAVNGVNLRWHACVNPLSYGGYRGNIAPSPRPATARRQSERQRRIRRAVKARGHFPNEQAALNAFDIAFDSRLAAERK
jgi:hypothetical protein